MKKWFSLILCTGLLLGCAACGESSPQTPPTLWVDKAENLPEDFIMGADVSSLVSLENSGVPVKPIRDAVGSIDTMFSAKMPYWLR